MGCIKLHILNEQYKSAELKVSYINKELTSKNTDYNVHKYHFHWRHYMADLARFTTQDPLQELRPGESAYSAFGNSPVNRIDRDGRQWEMFMEEIDGIKNYRFHLTGVLYNNSSQNLNMSALQSQITKQLGDIFNTSGDGYSVSFSSDLRVVTSVDEISRTDHVFQVVDQIDATTVANVNKIGGLGIKFDAGVAESIISGKNTRTIAHEVGHTGGLRHPDSWRNNIPFSDSDREVNLMTPSTRMLGGYTGRAELTHGQIGSMYGLYSSGQLNRHSPIGYRISGFSRVTPNLFVPTFNQRLKR